MAVWTWRVAGLAVACMLVSGQPAPAQDATASAVGKLRQGMGYAQARAILVGAGWQADIFPPNSASERCSGRMDVCSRYLEAESCSGTGLGFCRFTFTNALGRRFVVITGGMDLSVQKWLFE